MKVLVTGAAGFLGVRLIEALLKGKHGGERGAHAVDAIVAADVVGCPSADPRVDVRVGSVADPRFVEAILPGDADVIFHLAAVLSGQSEAEFDLGMQVNVDATRSLLEACRRRARRPRFVFASSVAVFGGPLPEVVPDDMALRPESSYGTEKAIAELMVSDYSRRGFIDGISCRLPTVAIRPGKPNSALSSFVSGIIREPLAGVESLCPVPLSTRLWITSPTTVTRNLVHASVLPTASLEGHRSVNLPGLCVTPGEMLASLERIGGRDARALVRCEEDPAMMRVVCTWPGAFDVRRAVGLGFEADTDIDGIVREYAEAKRIPDP